MKLELLDFIELDNYPSGSGIEFYDDKIYIVGDDSRDLLVMSKKWNKPTLINLFDTQDKKIPKSVKSDLEAMTVLSVEKKPHLLIIGSGATDKRNKALLLNLKNNAKKWIDLTVFYNRITATGIPVLNIEGIAEVNDYLVMVNRGNSTHPNNHLIITKSDFWKDQEKASLQTIVVDFENVNPPAGLNLGISGLTYSDKHEDLFLTISTEDTPNAIDDGKIGTSYLGVIENLYRKIGREKGKIKMNHLIDLPAANKQFEGFKIESVCVQSSKDHSIKLQLVADNDKDKTHLFKVGLSWG
ncbi:MAG: hypothetical protein ABIQ88_22025 [Chitinophagaceae bacterium]